MNPDIYAEIVDFIHVELGIARERLHPELRLAQDLGVDGADGLEFVEDFARRFRVDLTGFEPTQYFGPEAAANPMPWLWWRIRNAWPQFPSITLADLEVAARAGRWDPVPRPGFRRAAADAMAAGRREASAWWERRATQRTGAMARSNAEIAIHVPDLTEAEQFYGGVLGFRVVSRTDDRLEVDTGALRLYVNRDAGATRSFVPSFDVPDYATAKRALESAGCRLVPAAPNASGHYFQDPFGFVFDITERP